jgi:polysaccharide biosynthesis/export protein
MQVLPKWMVIVLAATVFMGCHITHPHHHAFKVAKHNPPPPDIPKELSKVALPVYTVEPPDILVIEAINIVPKQPYVLRSGDLISVFVPPVQTEPNDPISGGYPIQPGGIVNLGPNYGTVRVAGMRLEEAQAAIQDYLTNKQTGRLNEASVSVSLVEMAGKQQISGQHLVGPDGSITLGSYGSVPVVGLTLAQSKHVIEQHLRNFLEDPEVSVDVFAYNSKVYYVVTEGAGTGDGVYKFPITGNETVLDAMANINGTTEVSSKRIWIARPTPDGMAEQILPVDWRGVSAMGTAGTNYQIMPGDRIFVAEDSLVAYDTHMAKVLAPMERAAGFILLQTGLATRLSGKVLKGGGNPQGGGGGGGGSF